MIQLRKIGEKTLNQPLLLFQREVAVNNANRPFCYRPAAVLRPQQRPPGAAECNREQGACGRSGSVLYRFAQPFQKLLQADLLKPSNTCLPGE